MLIRVIQNKQHPILSVISQKKRKGKQSVKTLENTSINFNGLFQLRNAQLIECMAHKTKREKYPKMTTLSSHRATWQNVEMKIFILRARATLCSPVFIWALFFSFFLAIWAVRCTMIVEIHIHILCFVWFCFVSVWVCSQNDTQQNHKRNWMQIDASAFK